MHLGEGNVYWWLRFSYHERDSFHIACRPGIKYQHTLRFQIRAKATAAEMYSYINSNHFFSFKYKNMMWQTKQSPKIYRYS